MKRNEMLSIIEECTGYPYSEGGDYLSNKILNAIEQAGMLPPTTQYWIVKHTKENKSGRQIMFNYRDYHSWEPEDE